MRLVLGVVGENAEPLGRDAKKAFGPEGGTLGRGLNCNWQLPDPTNTLSSRHASIAFNGVGFTITDTSTNGVYINTVDVPVGRGNTAPLADGDTLYLAGYIISVSIENDPVEERHKLGLTGSNAVRIGGNQPLAPRAPSVPDNIGGPVRNDAGRDIGLMGGDANIPVDPLLAIGGGAAPVSYPLPRETQAGSAPPLPDPLRMFEEEARAKDASAMDQDLLAGLVRPAPAPNVAAGGAPFMHMPPGQFPPPPPLDVSPAAAPVANSLAAGKSAIIPDDFDFSDLIPGAKPPATPANLAPPPPPPIPPIPHVPPIAVPPAAPPPVSRAPLSPALANDFVALRPSGASARLPGERVLDPLAVLKERAAQRPANAPEPRNAVLPAPAAPSAAPLPPGADEMQAFWTALGLDPSIVPPERRQDILAELGQALREMANGLHSVLAARAMVKNEFQIEQTRIRSGDNNAFKFMKSGQDALRKSLAKDHGFLPLGRSVREGFHDIKAHEVASMMAMRAAVSNVLTRMSPQRLETDGASTGLFGGRADKAKLWDRFVELHGSMVNDIDRTTRTYIADEFNRSYESHVAALRQSEGKAT